jgi:hypothetical protein
VTGVTPWKLISLVSKNDAAVERRRERMPACLDVLVPKLDVSAPMFLPNRIEIDKNIESTMKFSALEVVEVHVNIEPAAWTRYVNAAAVQFLVGKQVWDAGYAGEV